MAEQTTTPPAAEEGPQQAGTTQREVVDITGNVARDPELRYTPGGKATSGSLSTATTGRHAGTP